ncbi:MAG TPA: tetrahydrofolate dehydrogenase/cyclohydrolase catalytic domain-containing protein [bacterium]|nr:tetrahydrofolate dehydrogenase/cyclohydrolase catalytic domain-containing protein [bacterium]
MKATLLEGKPLARRIEALVSEEVAQLKMAGVVPSLAVVLVGDDPASRLYVTGKAKACMRVGIGSSTIELAADVPQSELLGVIDRLNRDERVHGILVQLPLPAAIDAEQVFSGIDPVKDVDGLTPENLGKLLLGYPYVVPCTPLGILELLNHYQVPIEGANVVIVGRSSIVGKPLAALLMAKAKGRNCTVTVCHSRTRDVVQLTRLADMVVVAMGSPRFLKADMIKAGAIVIDVGVNRITDSSVEKGYLVVGDADFAPLTEVASYITPVPGGVGLLTVAMLLKNTAKVARNQACRP